MMPTVNRSLVDPLNQESGWVCRHQHSSSKANQFSRGGDYRLFSTILRTAIVKIYSPGVSATTFWN